MTAPITSALRRQMTAEGARVTADRDEFCGICDALDSIHARKLKALDASTARVDELCRENEGLRGLVRALDWCTENFDVPSKCDRCPLPQSKALEPECEVRMRELGIEVD